MQMVFEVLPNAVPVSGTKHFWQAELESCKELSGLSLEGTWWDEEAEGSLAIFVMIIFFTRNLILYAKIHLCNFA